jgi:CheY-like chemotaxis protein
MPGKTEQLRIVIANDNNDAANTLAKLLMLNGYRVQAIAQDGHSAPDSIRQLRADVAILDIGMPELSGNTVAKSLRAQVEPCPLLIALSGLGSECHAVSISANRGSRSVAGTAPLSDPAFFPVFLRFVTHWKCGAPQGVAGSSPRPPLVVSANVAMLCEAVPLAQG